MKISIRLATVLASMLLLNGCKSGSDEFGQILSTPSGGLGDASISITSFSPGTSSISVKSSASQSFIVAAVGQGALSYQWTLDGTAVGTGTAQFTLNAASYTIGTKVLKVVISDSVGSATQEWSVKVNGTPVVDSSLPSPAAVSLRRGSTLNYSVSVSDPNSDALTYVWKLDGQEDVLASTTSAVDWSPQATDVGKHTVAVDIYDGPISDAGTYKVTRSWTTYVNHFADSCNTMENSAQTNKACVYVGIAGIGDGLNPQSAASSFYLRPTAIEKTPESNLFISDDLNNVVWFYNLSTAPSATVLGVTVPVNSMRVVAGVGMASSGNSASSKALRLYLNAPGGVAWDGSNLFISDTSANRVLKVDSTGTSSVLIAAGCNSPRGMTVASGVLYVACYSSQVVKSIDIASSTVATFAGTGAAGNPANLNASSFTDATNGKLNGPYGVTSDSVGNIYVSEYTACRIRLYNLSAGTVTLYGSYNIPTNNQRVIVGAATPACASTTGEPIDITGAANGQISNVRHIHFNSDGLLVFGHDADSISAVNFDPAAGSVLGVSIGGYEVKSLLGLGSAGYGGEGLTPATARFNNPYDAVEISAGGDYFISDYGNSRFRKFRSSDSKTETVAGNGSQRAQTNAGQGTLEAGAEKMNNIRGLAVDAVTGETFIADQSNHRIRVLSRYGVVSQAVGTGTAGSGSEEDEYPSNVTMNQPRGLTLTHATATFGGHLVWADSQNRRIRILNRGTSSAPLFGVTVSAGKVATIGGDGTAGNATSGSALQSAFNQPGGVAFDGTSLYVSDTSNHCIKRIDASGTLSVAAGTCGSAGNINGVAGVGRLNSPEGIDYYSANGHRGIVIADRGNTRVRFLRLAGSSLLFGGSISVGDANTIACGGTFHTEQITAGLAICSGVYDVAAVGSNICFTNYTYHNARCVKPSGEINSVMGQVQGIDDTTPLFAPGTPLAAEDYSSTDLNFGSQNGVTAFYLPSPLAEPAVTDSFGRLNYPMSIRPIDSSTLLIGEYGIGMIRKVKLP